MEKYNDSASLRAILIKLHQASKAIIYNNRVHKEVLAMYFGNHIASLLSIGQVKTSEINRDSFDEFVFKKKFEFRRKLIALVYKKINK